MFSNAVQRLLSSLPGFRSTRQKPDPWIPLAKLQTDTDIDQQRDAQTNNTVLFMITEYQGIIARQSSHNAHTDTEIHIFYVVVTSCALAAGFLFDYFEKASTSFLWLTLGLLLVLLMIGLITLSRATMSRVQNVVYLRSLNRIRRYFADSDLSVQPYMLLPIYDDLPDFLSIGRNTGVWPSVSTGAGTLVVVNSAIASTISLCAITVVNASPSLGQIGNLMAALISVAVFVVFGSIQVKWIVSIMKHHERIENAKSRFPRPA